MRGMLIHHVDPVRALGADVALRDLAQHAQHGQRATAHWSLCRDIRHGEAASAATQRSALVAAHVCFMTRRAGIGAANTGPEQPALRWGDHASTCEPSRRALDLTGLTPLLRHF